MIIIQVGDQAIRTDLAELYRRLGNLKPVMESIGMELESHISARFETRTDPDGQRWAPWAPSYQPTDGNLKLLDRYGDMLRSLTHRATKDSVKIGFGTPYSVYHEWGTSKMPRRGLLFSDPDSGTISPGDQAAVLDMIALYLAPD